MNYELHYAALIERSRHRGIKRARGFELHHVQPKCLGGTDDQSNLVLLTPEEHYVAHQLLVRMHPGNYSITYSAYKMTVGRDGMRTNNKRYSWLKKRFSDEMSEYQKGRFSDKRNHPCYGKFGPDHPHYGNKHSEETKQLISASSKGRVASAEARAKMSASQRIAKSDPVYKEHISKLRAEIFLGEKNPMFGRKHSEEARLKMKIAAAKRWGKSTQHLDTTTY